MGDEFFLEIKCVENFVVAVAADNFGVVCVEACSVDSAVVVSLWIQVADAVFCEEGAVDFCGLESESEFVAIFCDVFERV